MRFTVPAGLAVRKAVKTGLLKNLKQEYVHCADCGNRATEYDHRSYLKTLDVQPVCRSCNVKRGPAIEIIGMYAKDAKAKKVKLLDKKANRKLSFDRMTKQEAIALFDTVKALAAALGVGRHAIYMWPDILPQGHVDRIMGAKQRLKIRRKNGYDATPAPVRRARPKPG